MEQKTVTVIRCGCFGKAGEGHDDSLADDWLKTAPQDVLHVPRPEITSSIFISSVESSCASVETMKVNSKLVSKPWAKGMHQ